MFPRFQESPRENRACFGVAHDSIDAGLRVKMDDELKLACLREEVEEFVEGFECGSEASFQQSLKWRDYRG